MKETGKIQKMQYTLPTTNHYICGEQLHLKCLIICR